MKILFTIMALLTVAPAVYGDMVCINTKVEYFVYPPGIRIMQKHGNHAYVTVERDGKLLHSTGFWENLKFDKFSVDGPYDQLTIDSWHVDGWVEDFVLTNSKFCIEMGTVHFADIKALALMFVDTHGEYHYMDNNCTHFAVQVFEQYTRIDIPIWIDTPAILEDHIRRFNVRYYGSPEVTHPAERIDKKLDLTKIGIGSFGRQ